MDCVFDVEPLNKKIVKVPLGKEVDDNLSLVVTVLDKKKEIIYSQEQVIFEQKYQKMFANSPLFDGFKFENSKVVIELNNDEILTSNNEYNLLYRAGTDNDMDIFYNPGLAPYYEQSEKLLSKEDIPNGIKTVTEVTNKKGKYLVTDTYEGCDEGIIVTSTLKAIKAKGEIPRFGKCFYLPSSFESVRYIGRSGESYVDMKDQFIIKENVCRVEEMVEPNIKPQESGNRCDCREASLSSGMNKVTFVALEAPFELGIKPYSDRALLSMKHNKDEIRTGTYVTIQAFQKGIGTGSCGPVTAEEYRYYPDKEYTFKLLIKVSQ